MIKHVIRIMILSLLCTLNAYAQSTPIAKVVWVQGNFTANGRLLQKRSLIYQNDVLRTGNQSQAQIVFSDNALMTLKENTNFSVNNYQFKKSTGTGSFAGNLVTGGFRTITGLIGKHDPEDYHINTPVATLGVRGTDYQAVLNHGALYVEVYQGKVCMSNSASNVVTTPVPHHELASWMHTPAVYMPQVLAIPDERLDLPQACPDSGAPEFLGGLDSDQTTPTGEGSIDLTPYFSGSNLVFSLESVDPALLPGDVVTVSPGGILTFDSNVNFYEVSVRATNACGSATTSVFEIGPQSA